MQVVEIFSKWPNMCKKASNIHTLIVKLMYYVSNNMATKLCLTTMWF